MAFPINGYNNSWWNCGGNWSNHAATEELHLHDESFDPIESGLFSPTGWSTDANYGDSSSPDLPELGNYLNYLTNSTEVNTQPQVEESRGRTANKSNSGNSRRCQKYRTSKKRNKKKDQDELNTLMEQNNDLKRKKEELAIRLETAQKIYLDCISSGKIQFNL